MKQKVFKTFQCIAMAGIIAVSVTSLTGCMAAAVGLGAAALADDSEDKKAFHENNTTREKAGLKPLTYQEWEDGQNASSDGSPSKKANNEMDKRQENTKTGKMK